MFNGLRGAQFSLQAHSTTPTVKKKPTLCARMPLTPPRASSSSKLTTLVNSSVTLSSPLMSAASTGRGLESLSLACGALSLNIYHNQLKHNEKGSMKELQL